MVHYVPASLDNVTQVVSYVLDKANDAEMKSIVKSASAWCGRKMVKEKLGKETLAQLERYRQSIPKASTHLIDGVADLEECNLSERLQMK